LSISFALPTFAQQTNTPDPQIVQQLHAIDKKSDEAFLKGDAVAVASFFTKDAVLVNDTGPVYGRRAIEKYYADMFQILHYFSHHTTYDPTSPHPIGTDGNGVWENGEWSSAIAPRGEDCGPRQIRGYFGSVKVREGDTWKVRMATYNLTPAPPATSTTTIAP
jgi:ketosteroid isomerase-like protein